jgi:hypothetical protein
MDCQSTGLEYYPIIGGLHLLTPCLIWRNAVGTDLRLLGWAMRRRRDEHARLQHKSFAGATN